MAKITLIGMYNWDDTLFELLNLPDGLDKQTLIDDILLRGGEFEVLYPDLDFLKYSIGAWSRKYQSTFVRWANVLNKEYNPIENYDRMESWTDNGSTSGSMSGNSSGSTSGTTGSTTTGKVSAYDAGEDFTNKDQTEIHGTDSSTSSSTTGQTTSGTTSGTHEGRIHGNIGVMSAQNMVNQELDLGYRNIYNMMTDLFLTEFILPIY